MRPPRLERNQQSWASGAIRRPAPAILRRPKSSKFQVPDAMQCSPAGVIDESTSGLPTMSGARGAARPEGAFLNARGLYCVYTSIALITRRFRRAFSGISSPTMALAPGTKLGPYVILSPLGAGGMGEVYRAKDTRLGRDVAIKILPKEVSADAARKQRFEREAKTISGLNHPNTCVLYDVGSQDGVDSWRPRSEVNGEIERGEFALGTLGKFEDYSVIY